MLQEESKMLTEQKGHSEIVDFFQGKTIFITGGTGFMGKILVESLLRCCPDIKRIYILCRPKKGKTVEERMEFLLSQCLFDEVRNTQPEVLSKIVALAGDHMKPNLGMSNEDINKITNETNVVFHMAATTRFDEVLRLAVPINVRSTKDLLFIARRMSNLVAFVHVSTAYANCIYRDIKEEFYQPPIDGDHLIEMTEGLSDDMLLRITPGLIGDYPNTYTFTKCVAEDLIKKYSAGLPISIVRPSIVTCVHNAPNAGWIDSIYGPAGLGMGLGLGILHVIQSKAGVRADFIPADTVTNGIIAVAWNIGRNAPIHPASDSVSDKIGEIDQAKNQKLSSNDENSIQIYHSVSSEHPLTWETGIKLIVDYALRIPSNNIIWKPFCTVIENDYLFNIRVWMVHWIPAYLADAILKLIGKKPMLIDIYKKAEKFQSAQKYFTTKEWTFATNNMRQLINKLSDADKKIFPVDIKEVDWVEHVDWNCDGIKRHFLKEGHLKPAYNKLRMFTIAHYTFLALLLFLLFKLFISIFY